MVEEKDKPVYIVVGSAVGSGLFTLLSVSSGLNSNPAYSLFFAVVGSFVGGIFTYVILG